jgi:hypothetical protein
MRFRITPIRCVIKVFHYLPQVIKVGAVGFENRLVQHASVIQRLSKVNLALENLQLYVQEET